MEKYIFLSFLVILFFDNCFGLKCYQCNSDDDNSSSACANVTTQRVTDCKNVPELFEDPKHTVSEYDFSCMTVRVSGTEGGLPEKVVRSCLNYNISRLKTSGCIDRTAQIFAADDSGIFKYYRFTLNDTRSTKGCYCKTDGCNDDRASYSNTTSHLSTSGLVLLLLLFVGARVANL